MRSATAFLLSALVLGTASSPVAGSDLPSPDRLGRVNVEVERVLYRGQEALRLVEVAGVPAAAETLAVLPGAAFRDGTIELEIAGAPRAGTEAGGARGFVGLAFRLQREPALRYECFYLRPSNGRAEDQLRRNHSTQYVSHPEYTWRRLREESPGVYESYVGPRPGRVDARPNRGLGDRGAALRPRRGPALPHREGPEAGRRRGCPRPVDRAGHGGPLPRLAGHPAVGRGLAARRPFRRPRPLAAIVHPAGDLRARRRVLAEAERVEYLCPSP